MPGVICQNCGRDMTSRECADQAHREARGFPPVALPAFHRECPKCLTVKPQEKFWNVKARKFMVTCGTCRWKARQQRLSRLTKRALWRREEAASEQFWTEQAEAHT